MTLEACLPDSLRGPATSITRLTGGLSGAGVYRVEAGGSTYVLKVGRDDDPVAAWRQRVAIQERAAEVGVAPRVIHRDEARRAVVSEHIAHHAFAPRLFDPRTRDAAVRQLGETIARLHALPLPSDAAPTQLLERLAPVRAELASFAVPLFARASIDQALAAPPPPHPRPLVTSHNDLNPSNLAMDSTRLVFLDWDAAGTNDPFHDLATVALFLRMDDATAAALLAAHDDAPPAPLPAAFLHARRLVAALCATLFFRLAQRTGHPGGDLPVHLAPTLQDVHGLIGARALSPGSPDGAWAFALALARTLVEPSP